MSEQTMGIIVFALFTGVVVGDILWAYYGWVRMSPGQSLFVRVWLAAVALLAVTAIAAFMTKRWDGAHTMAFAALAGLLLLAGPLLTVWQERRPLVIAMNILSSLTSFVTILSGLLAYAISHIFGMTNYLLTLKGLALSIPLIIVTPICMVGSIRLARQGRRSAIYVAFIPVALAALVNEAVNVVPVSAPGWTWSPSSGRWY
jgi:hypothetical protein